MLKFIGFFCVKFHLTIIAFGLDRTLISYKRKGRIPMLYYNRKPNDCFQGNDNAKIRCICLVLVVCVLVFMSACKNGEPTPHTVSNSEIVPSNLSNTYYNFETDCQYNVANPPFDYYVAKGTNGYYILKDNYVFYTDVISGLAIPLCNKPNCLHNSDNVSHPCNANLSNSGDNITYNQGYIYYLGDKIDGDTGTSIMRMTVDGSGTRTTVYESEHNSYKWIIHRGNIYNAYLEYPPKSEYENSNKCRLVLEQISLDNTDETKVIYKSDEYLQDASFNYLVAFDDFVYYSILYYSDEDELIEKLCCYDTKNRNTRDVVLPEDDMNPYEYGVSYIYPLGDKLIFKAGTEIYQCDLNSENVKRVLTLGDEYHNVFTDGTYLYEDNFANYLNSELLSIPKEDSRIVKVYDSNLNFVDTLNVGSFELSFRSCDDIYSIVVNYDGTISWFDKSLIGNIQGDTWPQNYLEILV